MIPTFDFGNLLKMGLRAALFLLCNPISLMIVFSGTVFALIRVFLSQFDWFEMLSVPQIDGSIFDGATNFLELFAYCLAFSDWLDFLGGLIPAVTRTAIGFVSMSIGFFIAYLVWNASATLRNFIKDVAG